MDAAHRAFDRLAPAGAQRRAHQLLYRVDRVLAVVEGRGVHGRCDGADGQRGVDGQPHAHLVDRAAGRQQTALVHVKRRALAVDQFGVDVEQAILAQEALEGDLAGVQRSAGNGFGKGHPRF
jgi:hypothetical protein